MTHVRTVPVEEASGKLKEIYDAAIQSYGYIPNHTLAFSLRPDVLLAWRQLVRTIRGNLDERRFELISTFAAAKMRCRY